MKKLSVVVLILILGISKATAQSEVNPITTAAPFLLIAPDARAGGLADMGVATSPDVSSLHYNAANTSIFKIITSLKNSRIGHQLFTFKT